jgi:hypothetical protein
MSKRIWVVEIRFKAKRWEPDQVYATKHQAETAARSDCGFKRRVRAYEPAKDRTRKAGR